MSDVASVLMSLITSVTASAFRSETKSLVIKDDFAATELMFDMLLATVPISVASPATALIFVALPATLVTLEAMPATVVTFALIAARPEIASVAVVPSSISARAAMSVATEARVVTSVELGPASGAPVVELN